MGYTPEFWKRAYELIDQPVKQCEVCHEKASMAHRRVVELGPRDGNEENTNTANLTLLCNYCWLAAARRWKKLVQA